MIWVMIADDEEKVCQLIAHLVDWTELNMELAELVPPHKSVTVLFTTSSINATNSMSHLTYF